VAGGGWSGKRVELNAFTSPKLIQFIEHKFEEVGVAKVVPSGEALKRAYRRACATASIQEAIDEAMREAPKADASPMPQGLPSKITKAIKGTPKSWDDALSAIVRETRAKQAQKR
jgi:hypothetical protein